MSKTHPQEHEDYVSEIKKEMTSNRQSREDVLCQPMNLSPELADVIGKKVASRAECIYILGKIAQRLQDPENRRNFKISYQTQNWPKSMATKAHQGLEWQNPSPLIYLKQLWVKKNS